MSPRPETPLVCPICERALSNVQVRPLGPVTHDLSWALHAGRCPDHGWFQAEVISKPPREIFPVNRPGGTARRILIGGRPVFAFPTRWDSISRGETVDMYDPQYWAVDWSRLPDREDIIVPSS